MICSQCKARIGEGEVVFSSISREGVIVACTDICKNKIEGGRLQGEMFAWQEMVLQVDSVEITPMALTGMKIVPKKDYRALVIGLTAIFDAETRSRSHELDKSLMVGETMMVDFKIERLLPAKRSARK
jgi:hypothetical protein